MKFGRDSFYFARNVVADAGVLDISTFKKYFWDMTWRSLPETIGVK